MEVLKKYKELAASCPNITFHESGLVDAKLLNSADVLLSDASSVIVEAMMLDKTGCDLLQHHAGSSFAECH